MSVAGISVADHTDKLHKKSFHQRNDSGELDVFEAARYFSGYNEALGYNGSSFTQKMMMKDQDHHQYQYHHHGGWRGGRISLDMPMRNVLNNPHPQQSLHHHLNHHHQTVMQDNNKQNKDKKYKQPSSPGGRLASFLNSLFNQSASKKKKSKSTNRSMKDDQEEVSPGGGMRRKRRSSISHFRSSSTTDSKSIYSSSSSGFRTPPPYVNAQTPTKSYNDLRSLSDHKQAVSLSLSLSKHNNNNNLKSSANNVDHDHHGLDHEKRERDLSWLDHAHQKFKYSVKDQNKNNSLILEKDKNWMDKYPSEKKLGNPLRGFDDDHDDGADSDSSSDLFELQNYDLGCYSSGLPVYETTNMDNIKISSGAPISTA